MVNFVNYDSISFYPLKECKKNGDMCGQHHGVGNPSVNYGECCEGFKCIHPTGVLGAAGKCEIAGY